MFARKGQRLCRPPQKRAFIGLVGRNIPGDVVVDTLEPPQNGQEQPTIIIQADSAEPHKKRGRPSKHTSGAMSAAERMRAHRERKAEEQKADDNRRALIKAISEWPDWRGKYITDAPHGKGLLVTGGYDPEKVEKVSAAHELADRRRESGGLVRPTGHSLHSHENDKYDLFKEKDWTFVNRAFRRTYGLTKDEAEGYERQVVETIAYQQAYCSFGFQCQVCDEMVWSAERFAHFADKHPHLIHEQQVDQANADENEILTELARKDFVTILASFHCELCEDENAPDDRGFMDLSSDDEQSWDGDYISFVNLNRGAMVDHLYEKHSRVVSREVREFIECMTPGNRFKRMDQQKQKNCRVNHDKLAAEKAAEWKDEILATDRELKKRGDWAASDRPATYPCPSCGKKLALVIS